MKVKVSGRGFQYIEHPDHITGEPKVLVAQSSAIGDYEHSLSQPGSSKVWLGSDEPHHLNKEDVSELIKRLQYWVHSGTFDLKGTDPL